MTITCPHCQTRYNVAFAVMPLETSRLTCKHCGKHFGVPPTTPAAGAAQPEDPAAKGGGAAGSGAEGERWYIHDGHEQRGPFDRPTLDELLGRGVVGPATYVWRAGMQDWALAGSIPELHGNATPRAGAEPTPAQGPRSGTAYQNAPPGDATRTFMATAGLYKRRRKHRAAAFAGAAVFLGLVTLVVADLAGVLIIPAMGAVYEAAGIADPNVERAVARVESKLLAAGLSADEREALRRKLLGLQRSATETRARRRPLGMPAGRQAEPPAGVPPEPSLTARERSLAADVFADERKRERAIRLARPEEMQAPNLPAGLTAEAIAQVVNDNGRSMQLCLEEAYKKGDRPTGRMEVEVTIDRNGAVTDARVATPQFRGSAVGSCTIRRVRGWRFPRFDGEPVTVVFPYVLSTGL